MQKQLANAVQSTISVNTFATAREGISCVHPVQVYLDLKNHPERSTEAAQALRQNILKAAHA
ncbi:MAG: type IV toxin-antitoxin system AbiEi family antitoxin [Verrucomicrobia bacterium]|nr:type IV toxin-antitoxin system AbiEi family antitoxin [Verrucomicrobiota bacterium]